MKRRMLWLWIFVGTWVAACTLFVLSVDRRMNELDNAARIDRLPIYDIRQCDEEWRTRFIIDGVPNTQVCREAILKKEAAGEARVIGRAGEDQ